MKFLDTFWHFLLISSPYLLFGFLISGVVHHFLNSDKLKLLISRNKPSDIAWASLLGIPLPLCSCSVLPTAATLRKSGAGNGPTSSFLISTPESGIDSIAMSYSVLDPFLTIARPIVAFITALTAGFFQYFFNDYNYIQRVDKKDDCCSHGRDHQHHDHSHHHEKNQNLIQKILNFSFVELLDDMSNWLLVGLVLGAAISHFIPEELFSTFGSHANKLLILSLSVPLYICASASTPIAASLIMKGISPGTALIFLLAGPATNISNLSVIQKYIGKKGVIINLVSIISISYIASYIVDYFYLNSPIKLNLIDSHEHDHGIFAFSCTVLFLGLLLFSLIRVNLKRSH